MTKLAEDAVARAINYYKENPTVVFSTDSVIHGVIFGRSKRFQSMIHLGRTVNYNNLEWNTQQLFSEIGLTDKTTYYGKKNVTKKIGYRLKFPFDNLDDYIKENSPKL